MLPGRCCTFPILLLISALIAVLTSCSERHVKAPITTMVQASNRDYIDLQPGWRLRVVTPLGKAGDYRLKFKEAKTSGDVIALSTGEFTGYEVAYYAVESRSGGAIQIKFSSAELMQAEKSVPLSQSILPLFVLPRRSRFVRLVYLTRVSDVDHEMAVVASERVEGLDALTRAIQANQANRCGMPGDRHCAWIPPGVAVRPELQKVSDGAWVPAR
jgi:hypothetical protein